MDPTMKVCILMMCLMDMGSTSGQMEIHMRETGTKECSMAKGENLKLMEHTIMEIGLMGDQRGKVNVILLPIE